MESAAAWILAAVVVLAAALRVFRLDSGLWYDEIVTLLDSARQPLARILTHFPSNNDHPLYSVLARVSVVTLGEHPWTLRLPAMLFGVAAIPLLYLFGRTVTSRFEALAAAALLAVSYHHVWFSQNARGYTILLVVAIVSTHLLLVGLRDDRRPALVGYAVVSALGAYTHLTMVVIVVGQAAVALGHVLVRRRGQLERRDLVNLVTGFGLAALLTVLLYAPFLGEVQAFFGREPAGASVATPAWAMRETLRGLQVGYTTAGGIIVAGLMFGAGLWSYLRQSPTLTALFLLPGAGLFVIAVLLKRPTFPRFFFFLAGFAVLIVVRGMVVVAGGLERGLRRALRQHGRQAWLAPAVVAGAVIVSIGTLPQGYRHPKQDYAAALGYLDAHAGSDDVVVLAGGGVTLPYQKYYGKPWKRLTDAAELASTRRAYDDVWLLYTFRPYLEALEPDLMSEIVAHCPRVKVFPGTVAGGHIVVTKCRAG